MNMNKKIQEIRILIEGKKRCIEIDNENIEKMKIENRVKKVAMLERDKYRTCMKLLGRILYFENEFKDNIKNIIPTLTDEEISIIDYCKNLFEELQNGYIQQNNKYLRRENEDGIKDCRKILGKIKSKENNEKFMKKAVKELGHTIENGILLPCFSMFTEEEIKYLKKAYKIYLEDTYEETVEKERKFIYSLDKFDEKIDKIEEAGKKISNYIRNIEVNENLTKALGNTLSSIGGKLKESTYEDIIEGWRENIYKECMGGVPLRFKSFIPKDLLEKKFKEFMEELIFFSDEVYFKIESYEEQLKKEYLQEKGEECPEYVLKTTLKNKFGEEYYGTYCKFEVEDKETVELCRNAIEYYKAKYR